MKFCKYRNHCVACRTDEEWRRSLFISGLVKEINFECPYGVKRDTALTIQTESEVLRATSQIELILIARKLRQSRGSCCGQSELVDSLD